MKRRAYIFLPILGEEIPAAVIEHHIGSGSERYTFRYGERYLDNPHAFPIDPRQLPLVDRQLEFPRMPLAIQDAGPDDFGRYLYAAVNGSPPESELDYHLGNGNSIGAMTFSSSLDVPKNNQLYTTFSSISEIVDAFQQLERKKTLTPQMKSLMTPSLKLGGARPKALLNDGSEEWILKFERKDDIFNIPMAEHATMLAAGNVGIRCAESQVIDVEGHKVFATRRFDRDINIKHHYLSAFTLLGGDNINPKTYYEDFSYQKISNILKMSSPWPQQDRQELFTRMLFNVAVSNRDDHLKNHGFLLSQSPSQYRLSPCFDIVPATHSATQAISIGVQGPKATMENALSQANQFQIPEDKIGYHVDMVSEGAKSIPGIAESLGMRKAEVEYLNDAIEKNFTPDTSKSFSPSM